MGISHRRSIAWLAGSVIALFPHVTLGADSGPGKEVREIRSQARALLEARVLAFGEQPSRLTVDDVTAGESRATLSWHAGTLSGTDSLHYQWDRWWDDRPEAASTAGYLPVWHTGDHTDNPFDVAVRAPTEAESWHHQPGGNSFMYFTLTLRTPPAVAIAPGSTLDIWFPVVLDPSLYYTVTLAFSKPTVGPLVCPLAHNTLHCTLPGFAASAGTPLLGEINGNPYHP